MSSAAAHAARARPASRSCGATRGRVVDGHAARVAPPARLRERARASSRALEGSDAASAAPCSSGSSLVVLDGANMCWTFSSALHAKLGCRAKLPLSRGVTLALESTEQWDALGVTPVAFIPRSYVEGPLHGLADGGSLETLVPRCVSYVGDGVWRNDVLAALVERGVLRAVPRPPGMRAADDREILDFARANDALVCSNDRYQDHVAAAKTATGESPGAKKTTRRWLDAARYAYEFSVGEPTDAAFRAGRDRVERPDVGAAHLGPPPEDECPPVSERDGEESAAAPPRAWCAETHARGSSRPWALGADRWGRDASKRGGRRGRGKRRRRHTLGDAGGGSRKGEQKRRADEDAEFPYWALADEDLPVVFNLKKKPRRA